MFLLPLGNTELARNSPCHIYIFFPSCFNRLLWVISGLSITSFYYLFLIYIFIEGQYKWFGPRNHHKRKLLSAGSCPSRHIKGYMMIWCTISFCTLGLYWLKKRLLQPPQQFLQLHNREIGVKYPL